MSIKFKTVNLSFISSIYNIKKKEFFVFIYFFILNLSFQLRTCVLLDNVRFIMLRVYTTSSHRWQWLSVADYLVQD